MKYRNNNRFVIVVMYGRCGLCLVHQLVSSVPVCFYNIGTQKQKEHKG